MRHIIPVSGKDSLATALVQIRRDPDKPYELMFNPTEAEPPEVEEWLKRVEAHLGIPIQRVGKNLEEIIEEQGILPSIWVRYCTRLAKIYPMEDWIGTDEAVVYYGIRADENRTGYVNTKKPNITPVYPLVEEGVDLDGVYALLGEVGLMPPAFFWQSLYELVVQMLGEDVVVLERLHPSAHQQLFAWRARANCYWCFFQRKYEFIGLLEHHPELYWRAAEIEEQTGAEQYTWLRGITLRALALEAEKVKVKRARKVVRIIRKLFVPKQILGFLDEGQEEEEDVGSPDLLHVVSCGLFCGK